MNKKFNLDAYLDQLDDFPEYDYPELLVSPFSINKKTKRPCPKCKSQEWMKLNRGYGGKAMSCSECPSEG